MPRSSLPRLDKNDEPKPVFMADGLRLNDEGYALWNQGMVPLLD